MEELLNKLIKKWWKPFWLDDKLSSLHKEYGVWKWYIRFHNWMDSELFDLRQLTSKESWLWQFVCSRGLVDMHEWFYWQNIFHLDSKEYDYTDYQYWILESSLKDEDELEDFLIENINIS